MRWPLSMSTARLSPLQRQPVPPRSRRPRRRRRNRHRRRLPSRAAHPRPRPLRRRIDPRQRPRPVDATAKDLPGNRGDCLVSWCLRSLISADASDFRAIVSPDASAHVLANKCTHCTSHCRADSIPHARANSRTDSDTVRHAEAVRSHARAQRSRRTHAGAERRANRGDQLPDCARDTNQRAHCRADARALRSADRGVDFQSRHENETVRLVRIPEMAGCGILAFLIFFVLLFFDVSFCVLTV